MSVQGVREGSGSERTKLSLRVHLRIAGCRNLLMRESRQSVEREGLTLAQFDTLAELQRATRTGFTFGELSRLLLVTSGNLTGIVDHLEADGLARRQPDNRDRRVIRIVLTPKGRQLIERVIPRHARDIRHALGFLSDDELRTLEGLLRGMSEGLRGKLGAEG